jgi:hypothetical protein
MFGGYSQQLYILFALISAGILTLTGTKKQRLITFLLTLWLIGASIIHLEEYNLQLSFLGGEIQFKRIVFLVLSSYLIIFIFLKPHSSEPLKLFPFEKYFIAFILWFLVVIGYHFFAGILGTRDFVGVAEGILLVVVSRWFKYSDGQFYW